MLQFRLIEDKDYEELCDWWAEWGWASPMPQDMLPPNGIMVHDGSVNICAGFLYLMDAPIAWFTFPVSNPIIRGDIRKEAIKIMIHTATEMAKRYGAKLLYSALRNTSMVEAQKEAGFVVNNGYSELIKNLN